ncbi:hypothetical protein WDZ92_32010 [Nostoc sp. NIES-2111]
MAEPNQRHPARQPRAEGPGSGTRTALSDDEATMIAEAILRLWRIELELFALFEGATDPDEAFAAADPYFLAGNKLAVRILAGASHSREGTWARLVAEAHEEGHGRQTIRDMTMEPPSAPVQAIMDEALGGKGLVWKPSWWSKRKPGRDAG